MYAARKETLIIGAVLAGYVVASLFFGLGSYPLIDPDEPRYAQSAQEMIERGEYLVPHLCGKPRIVKPPLFYWLIVAARKAGVESWETAARLPSAAAGVLTALVVFALAREFYGGRAGALAVPVLVSMPLFAAATHLAATDALLTALLSSALYFWWRTYRSGGELKWSVISWALLALAFLTKGPVAPVLYALVVMVFCLIGRDWRPLRRSFHWLGILTFLALVLPWPLAVYYTVPGAVGIWWRETALRFTAGVDHGGNVLFPFAALAGGALPWWLLFGRGRLRFRAVPAALRSDPRLAFLFAWGLVLPVFFAISRSQLATYLLPALPPLAVGAGGVLARYWGGGERARGPLIRVFVGTAVLAAGAAAYGFSKGVVSGGGMMLTGGAVVVTAGILAVLLVRRHVRAAAALLVMLVAAAAFFSQLPALRRVAARRSFAPLAVACREQLDRVDELLFCGGIRHSLTFYGGCREARSLALGPAAKALAKGKRRAMVVRSDTLGEFEETLADGLRIAGRQRKGTREYVLIVNFDNGD